MTDEITSETVKQLKKAEKAALKSYERSCDRFKLAKRKREDACRNYYCVYNCLKDAKKQEADAKKWDLSTMEEHPWGFAYRRFDPGIGWVLFYTVILMCDIATLKKGAKFDNVRIVLNGSVSTAWFTAEPFGNSVAVPVGLLEGGGGHGS